jgi:hypothetical protein
MVLKTGNLINLLLVLMMLALMLPTAASCKIKEDGYMVQVWQPSASGEPKELLAYGVIVDDGNHVLTVLDYEEYTPANLLVVSPEYGQFNATVQAIDYRTSATLLQLEDANLPVAEIGEISTMESGQDVFILGWGVENDKYMKTQAYINSFDDSPLFFSVNLSSVVVTNEEGWVDKSGAIITDKNGKVIGLLGRYWNKLIYVLGGQGLLIPSAVTMDSALSLLKDSSYTSGPVISVVFTESRAVDIMPWNYSGLLINNIDDFRAIMLELLDKLGEPLLLDNLAEYSSGLTRDFRTEEGVMLVSVFTYPVELHDTTGSLIANAKWVGIQWDRTDGKPNRLIYGSTPYIIDGSYSIEGDISNLMQIIEPALLK